MKKKYISMMGIGATSLMMGSAVAIYIIRDPSKNIKNLNSFIFNNYCSPNNNYNFREDNNTEMYSYLSGRNSVSEKIVNNPITITSGYESLLSNAEKSCYSAIKFSANKISDETYKNSLHIIEPIFVEGSKLSSAQIKKIIYAVQNDNPEIFWISSSFSYRYSGNNTILKLNSTFSKNDLKPAMDKLNAKVKEIEKMIPNKNSEYEIELFLHDYIIANCNYHKITENDIQKHPRIFTSYGCLIDGSAVCEGYSKAMQLLMCRAGLQCRTITGARGNEAHMWNIVKINEKWYHLDVTWDSGEGFGKYNYFNVNDSVIKKDHTINAQMSLGAKTSDDKRYNFALPACADSKDNFFEKNAVKVNSLKNLDDSTIPNALINAARTKKEYIYLIVNPSLDKEAVKNTLFAKKPYRFFTHINTVNKALPNGYKINSNQLRYAEHSPQNVLIVNINYV